MLRIYGPPSSRTRRALWTAEEAGVAYEHVAVNLRAGEHKTPTYAALNPNLRVPVIEHDGLVLFESGAIALYIARLDPQRRLLPEPGTKAEALHDQWMFWVTTELEQPLWSMGKHRFALPEAQRIPAMHDTASFEWQRVAPVLAHALADRPFLLGDQLTVADLLAAHTLSWARGFRVPLGSDRLEAWLDGMLARPSHARTNLPATS